MRVSPPIHPRRSADRTYFVENLAPHHSHINWEGIVATLGISAVGWTIFGLLIELLR